MKKDRLYAYEVTTTQKCDMACTYCFEGEELQNTAKQRSTDDIIRSVHEMLQDDEFMKVYDGVILNFWGGEPTQNPKMIIQLINEFKDQNVHFFMYTNGFNRHNIERIINNFKLWIDDNSRLTYQISYDGISHDRERIDHKGEGTADRILENIKYLKTRFPEISFNLKSTLPVEELTNIVKHWEHFKHLVDEFSTFRWAPTLEYTNKYILSKEFVDEVEQQFKILAKREIEYYKENNRFVWSWFGTGERSVCTAGMNIGNVDIDGNLLPCHGAIYSPNKEDFIFGHITDENVPSLIMKAHERHKSILEVPEHCRGCEATVCYQCPIVNYDNSKAKTYEEKYHDPKDDLCQIYKAFGRIDRTVQRYLNI